MSPFCFNSKNLPPSIIWCVDGIFITINRCVDQSEGSQSFQNLKSAVDHFLKIQINFLVDIPETSEVRKSIIDQKLLAEKSQSNQAINSINQSIDKISKIHQVLNINQSVLQDSSISF